MVIYCPWSSALAGTRHSCILTLPSCAALNNSAFDLVSQKPQMPTEWRDQCAADIVTTKVSQGLRRPPCTYNCNR